MRGVPALVPAQAARLRALRLEKRRRAARESLASYVRLMWPVLEPGEPLLWGRHLDAMCEHLEAVTAGDLQRLVINVPPGTSKSTIVSRMWPTWWWLRRPELRMVGVAHELDIATAENVKRRDLVRSDRYQWLRPNFGIRVGARQKKLFQNDRQGVMQAASVGSAITGKHYDAVVIDDPHDAYDVSKQTLADAEKYFQDVLSSRFRSRATAICVIVMQRLHERDVAGIALAGESVLGDFEHLLLPMEFDPARASKTSIGWRDWRRVEGELLCPDRYPAEVLAPLKKKGILYATQYQQTPMVGAGGIFDVRWWRNWKTLPPVDEWLGVVDCNYGQGESPDYAVVQVWGRIGRDAYLVDQLRGQWQFPRLCEELERFAERWRPVTRWLVEAKANGTAIVSQLSNRVRGMQPVIPQGSKESRAAAVAPLVQAGAVYIPRSDAETPAECGADDRGVVSYRPDLWRNEYVNEHKAFPRGQYDDQVDATAMALGYWRGRIGPEAAARRRDGKAPAETVTTTTTPGAQLVRKAGTWVEKRGRG